MKSSASSIQPHFAAMSTRHCSAVIVRYQGAADEELALTTGLRGRESVVAEAARETRVGVDTPIAEKRPAAAHGIDLTEIDFLDDHDLAVDGPAHEHAPVRARDEALPPELDAARAARVGLEARAVH